MAKKRKINVKRIGILLIIVLLIIIILNSSKKNNIKSISTQNETYQASSQSQKKKCIVIDAGHGGEDSPGCVFYNVAEKDICLEIAKKVKEKLEKQGLIVIMTRSNDVDVSLKERIRIANTKKADVFVSIHQNALENDTSTKGVETWYNPEKDTCSKKLAQYIQDEVIKSTQAENKGIKESTDLAVIRDTKMASCLIETGFLSSKIERQKLSNQEYQNKIAEGIVNGIIKYVDI